MPAVCSKKKSPIDNGTEIKKTFNDISIASKKLANVFKAQGIGQGDVVIVILPRNIEWWIIFTACIRCGAMIAPGTTQLTAKDLEFCATKANAACIITNPTIAATFDEVADKWDTVKQKLLLKRLKTDGSFSTMP